jgi:hypothetical protein
MGHSGTLITRLSLAHQRSFAVLGSQASHVGWRAEVCLVTVTSSGALSGCTEKLPSLHLQVDGVLCLADILTDDSHSEATRAEAAAVVAQVTSPHLSFTQHLSSFLESMEEIVTALISELSWVGGTLG